MASQSVICHSFTPLARFKIAPPLFSHLSRPSITPAPMLAVAARRFCRGSVLAAKKVAVVTTRQVDNEKHAYIKQDSANIDMLARDTNTKLQMRPYMYHVQQSEPLQAKLFLEDEDDLDDDKVVEKKIKDLFDEVPKKLLLFVHGYNTPPEGALHGANQLHDATGLHVLAFDWASEHDLGLIPSFGAVAFPIITGYLKDQEEAAASVLALNWLMYIVLRGVDKVNILCHSMGSQITIASLYNLAEGYRLIKRDFNIGKGKLLEGQGQQHNGVLSNSETGNEDDPESEIAHSSKEDREEAQLQAFLQQYSTMLGQWSGNLGCKPTSLLEQYRDVVKSLNCVVFKQADCHIVAMRKFLERDLTFLNQRGNSVRIIIYSHDNDTILKISKVCPRPNTASRTTFSYHFPTSCLVSS
mmetsp:Transcript_12530/g.37619  ORF Transcript_12530/g.37619 Transcript_12530/m.37619 type:complete len:412 (-) Transcript_12530:1274-2509(-)